MDCSSQTSLSITNSWSLLKRMSIELVMPSNHLILCRPLLLLPSVFPSIRVFLNESVLCIRWPKYYWSFNLSISPSNEYSGLISFMTDWFDLAVQGTLKSLLQHHSSKASVVQHSAFPKLGQTSLVALQQIWWYRILFQVTLTWLVTKFSGFLNSSNILKGHGASSCV